MKVKTDREVAMKDYIHKVHYYETDKMGVTHHSNYVRWMEEARVDFLDQIGYGYAKMESEGIISPVIGIECEYKKTSTFDDEICIRPEIESYNGIKLVIRYTMTNVQTGDFVLKGKSKHCFLTKEGKPLSLRKQFPEVDKALNDLVCGE